LPAAAVLIVRENDTGSHAVLMDKVYRHQRYIYDLTRRYYLFGRDRMIRELALAPGESVVEVGCGTARNLIKIARRYPKAQLFGLDASAEMLETARRNLARAKLQHRVTLVQGYAEQLSPSLFGRLDLFDRALFPYSLSMIPDWRQALRAASDSLTPDGRLHVVDFGDLEGLGWIGAGVLRNWLGLFHVEPRTEIVRAIEHQAALAPGQRGQMVLLPGRYAFLWTAGRAGIGAIGLNYVAQQTQAGGNSSS